MADYDDNTAHPVFDGATAKRDLLRAIVKYAHREPNLWHVMFRINNTDLNAGLTDGATVYDPVDTFESA